MVREQSFDRPKKEAPLIWSLAKNFVLKKNVHLFG